MSVCWVQAGQCGQETTIAARKVAPTKVAFEITSTCGRIQALAEALGEVDVAAEVTKPLAETQVCTLATQHVCRNSCVVPAAILKAMEVAAGLFLPGDCRIEFVTDAI
ncbi:MAG: DUF6951 family protein [Anaerolineae bacterium]